MGCEHFLTPMVVDDLDVVRISLPKRKADAPACVHGHRPLALTIASELVQTYALQGAEVPKRCGDIQREQQIDRRIYVKRSE